MLIRALILVLAVLNVGVAMWWMTRGDAPVEVAEPAVRAGVATLELLPSAPAGEPAGQPPVTDNAGTEEPAVQARAEAPASADASERCVSLGPYTDRDTAQAALQRIGGVSARGRLREQPTAASGSYRVMLPASPSRAQAQAVVERIVAAGISDYYVIGQGEEANAIALGQYRHREGAERRRAELVAAGFPAEISGGEAGSRWWIDAATTAGTTPAALQSRARASGHQSLDCARLR